MVIYKRLTMNTYAKIGEGVPRMSQPISFAKAAAPGTRRISACRGARTGGPA